MYQVKISKVILARWPTSVLSGKTRKKFASFIILEFKPRSIVGKTSSKIKKKTYLVGPRMFE